MSSSPKSVKRIMAVSAGGLGDTILFSPVLKALCSCYPSSRIELLLENRLAQIAFSQAGEIDSTIIVNISHPFLPMKIAKLIPLALKLSMRRGFDVAAIATGVNPKLSSFLKFTAGIRNVFCAPTPPVHQTDLACNVALARRFDANISEGDVFIPLTEESREEAVIVLERYGISWDENKIIAVYPSTLLRHRPRWELSNLGKVIWLLRKEGFHGKVVVVGSSKEGEEWANIDIDGIADANLAGKLSILGSASLLNRCCLAIGNDGGIMHVAGAVGCPLVVVMTNTPLSYRPPGQKTKIIHSNLSCCDSLYPKRPKSCKIDKCSEDISTEEVFQACLDILND